MVYVCSNIWAKIIWAPQKPSRFSKIPSFDEPTQKREKAEKQENTKQKATAMFDVYM